MKDSLKATLKAWHNLNVQKNWYKAWTFIANAIGFLLVAGPDIVNMLIANVPAVLSQMPTMSASGKLTTLMTVNVLSILLKPWLQKPGSVLPAAVGRPSANGQDD